LLDPATGKTVRLIVRHTLLSIKIEYWCLIVAPIRLLMLLKMAVAAGY